MLQKRSLLALFLLAFGLPAKAQVGLPLREDGRIDYAQIFEANQPVEVVFCLDISGSMWQQNLPNAKKRLMEIYSIARGKAGARNLKVGLLTYYEPATYFLNPRIRRNGETGVNLAPLTDSASEFSCRDLTAK